MNCISICLQLCLTTAVLANALLLQAQELETVNIQAEPYPARLFSSDMNKLPKTELRWKSNIGLTGYVFLTTQGATKNQGTSSIQLIDLQHPEVPVWFACTDESPQTFFTDCKLQPDGALSFFLKADTIQIDLSSVFGDSTRGGIEGYFEMNEKLEPVDFFTAANINDHDYKKYPNGERLFLNSEERIMDLTAYEAEGRPLPEKATVGCESIVLLDSNNQVVFYWNPLDHLDFSEMYLQRYLSLVQHNQDFTRIQFSRTNSINIDPLDGNILASFRRSDMCLKIERSTGKILWRLGGVKSDFVLDDTSRFYLQHDFKRIASGEYKGCYSLFNNGSEEHPGGEGLIYRLDEENKKAVVLQRISNTRQIQSFGQGNFDIYEDSTAILNYGNVNPTKDTKPSVISLFKNGKLAAEIRMPQNVIVYRAVWLKKWKIVRPPTEIIRNANCYAPVLPKQTEGLVWSENDTLFNITPAKLPRVFYKKAYGFGYLVSEPGIPDYSKDVRCLVFPKAGKEQLNAVIFPESKGNLTTNFNGLPYTFKKKYVDTKNIFMILKR